MSSNRAEEWKKIAKDLYEALLMFRDERDGDCGPGDPMSLIEFRDKSMESYQNKNQLERQTL